MKNQDVQSENTSRTEELTRPSSVDSETCIILYVTTTNRR